MAALAEAGVGHETLTLHVGAGTFLPVKADDTADHVMHSEWGRIPPMSRSASTTPPAGGRIIPVGTTSLRLLESAADEAARSRLRGRHRHLHHARLSLPRRRRLVTNFHLPRSTLFMLVSALMGRTLMQAAMLRDRAGLRFYSYGDASLLP
jgi:S-adenosylmethionine:tRNA ribosyltransferase-isomerase